MDFFIQQWPAILGSVLISLSCAWVGTFTYLRKQSLLGDVVAHSVLPGVCIAFMIAGGKNTPVLLAGGSVTGWLAVLLITRIGALTKLKPDTLNALVLSVFFGFGILLLTLVQHDGNASQSGLQGFLFGKAAAITSTDNIVFSIVLFVILTIIFLLFHHFTITSFDRNYATVSGFRMRFTDAMLTLLIILTVTSGITTVGVVLVSALLVIPPLAARFWVFRVSQLIMVSSFIAVVGSLGGTYVSAQYSQMPTGPWIVLILAGLALVSFLAGSDKGLLVRGKKKGGLV